MTKIAQLLLVLTSLAPIGLVYAAVCFDHHQANFAEYLILLSALLVVVCLLLLWGLAKRLGTTPRTVKEPETNDAEPLAFLVAYALPLVSAKADDTSKYGLLIFALMMALAVWQLQIMHINPLLGLLGFHFITVKADDGSSVLIIARTKSVPNGTLDVVPISDYIWLHHPNKHKGGPSGHSARDSAKS